MICPRKDDPMPEPTHSSALSHSTELRDSDLGSRFLDFGSALPRWQRACLLVWVGCLVLMGIMVEIRSAYLRRPMTDLQVYCRAAWAIRSGNNIYTITDKNHWHYHYPALFAILMTPFADPPDEIERHGMLPFALSVRSWYLFSVLCLGLAANWLARALEETSADPSIRGQVRGCRRWWSLRVLPLVACLPPIAQTLMRGQVNLLLLALLCGMAAAAVRGQSWRAGLWLAGAICLKIIPAFLIIYPLWRRDYRWLAGCALGLIVGLALVPAAVLGPRQAWDYTAQWGEALLRPAFHQGGDSARDKELLATTATDSQSVERLVHNILYPNPYERPANSEPWVRWLHWIVGGLLTLLTLAAARGRRLNGPRLVICLGCLTVVMLLVSPVSHQHYMSLLPILAMGLLACAAERGPGARWSGRGVRVLFGLTCLTLALPHVPGLADLRDWGVPAGAALVLWLVGCIVMWRGRSAQPAVCTGDLDGTRSSPLAA
jgi:hypothetical protein